MAERFLFFGMNIFAISEQNLLEGRRYNHLYRVADYTSLNHDGLLYIAVIDDHIEKFLKRLNRLEDPVRIF